MADFGKGWVYYLDVCWACILQADGLECNGVGWRISPSVGAVWTYRKIEYLGSRGDLLPDEVIANICCF